MARALSVGIGSEPQKVLRTRAKAVKVLLDFDGSLYWQRGTALPRVDFEARLSTFKLHKDSRQLQLLLSPFVLWCDVLDAITDFSESGVQGLLMRGGPGPRRGFSFPLLPDEAGPESIAGALVLIDAVFEGSRGPTETSHDEWCVAKTAAYLRLTHAAASGCRAQEK